jgi:hypothetical protein
MRIAIESQTSHWIRSSVRFIPEIKGNPSVSITPAGVKGFEGVRVPRVALRSTRGH